MSDKSVMVADETEAETGAGSEGVVKIPCAVYSRIVGYLRPIESWNLAKRQEFKDRKVYKFQP